MRCRYADDGLLHCSTEKQAQFLLRRLRERFRACGLELHPEKTKIVYCKDHRRTGNHELTSFEFLGYTFVKRVVKGNTGDLFLGFCPGISRLSPQGDHPEGANVEDRVANRSVDNGHC